MSHNIFLQGLSVLVPCYNEALNLQNLVQRTSSALTKAKIAYEIIIIDDHSNDDTAVITAELAKKYPLKYHLKLGKRGKAFSLIEGAKIASFSHIAMIDGDLQYPPESLPEMYAIASKNQLVIAKRLERETSFLRVILSKVNQKIMQLLTGFRFDIQSGMKVFSKEVIDGIAENQVSSWTLDLQLLERARLLHQSITSVNIKFAKRNFGESKVSISTMFEIFFHTLKYRLWQKNLPQYFQNSGQMKGAGVVYKGQKYITHTTLSHEKNSLQVFTRSQIVVIGLIFLSSLAFLVYSPINTLIAFLAFISIIHFFDMTASLLLIVKSLAKKTEIHVTKDELATLETQSLPYYTILCPLYKEAHIIPEFLANMAALDYPKDRLEVMLLLEEDDTESINVVNEMFLPSFVSVEVVPYSLPKTKPKACNWGLLHSKGEYIVIYDAEDVPDTDQLKKAIVAFQKLPKNTFCLQAKLNYHNPTQNLLTRFFTAEYSMWFETVLPGLQSVNTFIPLGGTSNHFRRSDLLLLEGWDAFNVTEDCDLGMRVFASGYRTAIIDSTTLEEANSSLPNWIRQRSRWVKGYMQSYLIQMRRPWQFLKEHKADFFLFQFTIGGRIFSLFINPILWFTTILYFAFRPQVGEFIESLFPTWVFYLALSSLTLGNFMYLYFYMIGTVKAKKFAVTKWSLLVPIYWLAISTAALKAFYQLLFKPHYWEKTLHGLHLSKAKSSLATIVRPSSQRFDFGYILKKRFPLFETYALYFCVSLLSIYSAFLLVAFAGYFVISVSQVAWIAFSMGAVIYLYWNYFTTPFDKAQTKNVPRILIMNWRDIKNPFAGGAEVYLHELAKRYQKRGMEVVMLTGNDGSLPVREVIDGVKIHRSALSSLNWVFNLFLRLGNTKNKYPKYIDGAVYLANFWNYLLYYRGRCDLVIDSQNGLPFFTPLYVKENSLTLIHHVHQEIFYKSLPPLLSGFAAFLERFVMSYLYKNSNFMVVSQSTKSDLMRLNWASEDRINIVHPGVDLDLYKKTTHKYAQPTLLFVGRLTYYKSVHVLLKVAKNLLPKIPNLQVLIAGDGDMRKSLEKTSKTLGIEQCVHFLGKVSEAKKVELYQKSHIFVNPSFMEGWGITNIEANACATPVVASDVPGIRNSILQGESGYLVKYGDIEAFCEKIELLLNDKQIYQKISKEARLWASNFSWEKTSAYSLQLMQNLPNKNNPMIAISQFLQT